MRGPGRLWLDVGLYQPLFHQLGGCGWGRLLKVGFLIGALSGALLGGCSRPARTFSLEPASIGPYNGGVGDGSSGRRDLNLLISEQLDAELQFSPTLATWLGDHSSDDRLDDVRIDTISREIIRLDAMAERLRRLGEQLYGSSEQKPEQKEELAMGSSSWTLSRAISPGGFLDGQRLDLQLVQARVEAKRLELLELRPFERNPIYYENIMAFGLDSLIGPNLLSVAGMRALRGRLSAVPMVCREAQRNLKNPPEIWTRRALEVAQMTRDFVALLLPRMLANVTLSDSALLDDVNRQREAAQHALEEHVTWLGRELLPRSKGDWSLPRDRFHARLRAVELLDVPLETLQNVVELEHRETRRRFDEIARRLAGQGGANSVRAAAEAMRAVEEDHPRPEELLRAAESALDRAMEMVADKKFLSLPTARPQVTEMPAYRFGFVLLSMPALLEPDRPAQLFVDPVDPSFKDRKRITDHLRMLNRSQLLFSALHEVSPGHYTQQLLARQKASGLSPIRLRTQSTAFLEGWANYAAQTLIEESVPPGPAGDRLQLLALRIALLRLGRLLAAIHLHAPWPGAPPPATRLEDAVHFFVEECYLDEYAARREAERLTYDPLCGLGALGQLQLSQLASDYQAEQGSHYSMRGFHDALLSQGALPIFALRRLLLSQPGPSLLPPPEPPPSPLLDDASSP